MSTSEENKVLAEKGSWDDFAEEDNGAAQNGVKTLYMDTSKPGKYTIRPIGPHIKCRKIFKPYRATLSDADKDTDPAWKAGFYPQKRYAINVIDRADGKLKILEKGAQVFKQLANYKAVFGKNPSDAKEGVDFLITVTIPRLPNGQPNKLKTEYAVMHIKETPLTKEEIEMVKAQKLWPLTEIYKSTSLEKRMEMWNALPETAKIAPKRTEGKDDDTSAETSAKAEVGSVPSPAPVSVVEEKMSDAPAASDDLFEDNVPSDKSDSANLF